MPFRFLSITHAFQGVAAAAAVVALSGCTQQLSVESADIPSWTATALPTTGTAVAEGAGKILNRQPVSNVVTVPEGNYTLVLACDGGGKAFLTARVEERELIDFGAACNGARENIRLRIPQSGPVEFAASSVDAPLLYAYQLVPRP